MGAGVLLTIGSLLYIIVLAIVYFKKVKLDSIENRIFKRIIISNIFGLILHLILFCLMLYVGTESISTIVVSKLYLVYLITYMSLFTFYVFAISAKEKVYIVQNFKKIIAIVVLIIAMTSIFIFYLPIQFHDEIGKMYSYGLAVQFVYVFGFLMIMLNVLFLLKNINQVLSKQYYPLFLYFLLGLITTIIQYKYPYIQLITAKDTFIIFLMYFTIENPDIKMAKDLAYSKKIVEDSRDKTMEMLDFMSSRLKKLLNNMNNIDSLDTDDPKEIKKEFKSIQKQYLELTDDISGLIDLGKIESGYLELNKDEYLTSDLSEDIKKILSYSYKRQKVKTAIEFDTDIPPVLYGDKEKVEQMFLYTYEYLVEIIKQGKLEIKVDTIKVNNLCKLKFILHSIDTNIPSEESVEDIKYLKVKKLAELINAKFKYSDNNILELSIIQKVKDPYKLLTQEIDNANIKYFNAQDKKVLIITNKIMDTKELKLLLEPYHIEADSSRTFEEAKEKMLGDTTYDLIFIDDIIENKYIMRKNPYEIKFLKKFAGYEFKCIIMLRKRFADEYDYYFEKGYDDYIVKPIDKKSLDNILIKYLKNK